MDVRSIIPRLDSITTRLDSVTTRLKRNEKLLTQILQSANRPQVSSDDHRTSVTLIEDIIPQPFEDVVKLECFVGDELDTIAKQRGMVND